MYCLNILGYPGDAVALTGTTITSRHLPNSDGLGGNCASHPFPNTIEDGHQFDTSHPLVSKYHIPAHNLVPNTSVQNKPLLHYHGIFPSSITASAIESHLSSIGVVTPQWRYTMYSTTHFHSTSHEVLCISRGKATLCFGGEKNTGKVELEAQKGDMLVVPAGVGHRLLKEEEDGQFEMVGSYPKGCNWDMCYGKKGEQTKVNSIKKLPWFTKDPAYGDQGPVLDL